MVSIVIEFPIFDIRNYPILYMTATLIYTAFLALIYIAKKLDPAT